MSKSSPRKEAKVRKAPKSPQKKKKVKVELPTVEFIEEDVRLVMEATHQQEQRYPVIDPARPFVCQKCGVSFAREKALLSHSKVNINHDDHQFHSKFSLLIDVRNQKDAINQIDWVVLSLKV